MSSESTTPTVARSVDGSVSVALYNEIGTALSLLKNDLQPASTQTEADWASIAVHALAGEGVTDGNLEIFLVDEQRMAELNAEHMGQNGSTDVLAFPLDGLDDLVPVVEGARAFDPGVELGVAEGRVGEVERHLGDVVICPQVASAQALDHAGSFDAEVTLLVIHGVLHVLGHDHYEPGEAVTMRSKEQIYLTAYGFVHPGPPDESVATC